MLSCIVLPSAVCYMIGNYGCTAHVTIGIAKVIKLVISSVLLVATTTSTSIPVLVCIKGPLGCVIVRSFSGRAANVTIGITRVFKNVRYYICYGTTIRTNIPVIFTVFFPRIAIHMGTGYNGCTLTHLCSVHSRSIRITNNGSSRSCHFRNNIRANFKICTLAGLQNLEHDDHYIAIYIGFAGKRNNRSSTGRYKCIGIVIFILGIKNDIRISHTTFSHYILGPSTPKYFEFFLIIRRNNRH